MEVVDGIRVQVGVCTVCANPGLLALLSVMCVKLSASCLLWHPLHGQEPYQLLHVPYTQDVLKINLVEIAHHIRDTMQSMGRALALGDVPGGVAAAEQMAADVTRIRQVCACAAW
jgi:hypothetical protein